MTAIHWIQKRTPQELLLLGGSGLFYGRLDRLGCVLRLCIISVQPLAQVVLATSCITSNSVILSIRFWLPVELR